jgi:hypothetical protein
MTLYCKQTRKPVETCPCALHEEERRIKLWHEALQEGRRQDDERRRAQTAADRLARGDRMQRLVLWCVVLVVLCAVIWRCVA